MQHEDSGWELATLGVKCLRENQNEGFLILILSDTLLPNQSSQFQQTLQLRILPVHPLPDQCNLQLLGWYSQPSAGQQEHTLALLLPHLLPSLHYCQENDSFSRLPVLSSPSADVLFRLLPTWNYSFLIQSIYLNPAFVHSNVEPDCAKCTSNTT